MSHLERMYLGFLFVAYSAVWVIMFGFLYRMLGRARTLERDLNLLKTAWNPEVVLKQEAEKSKVTAPMSGPSV